MAILASINRVYCTRFPIAQQLSRKSSTKDSLFLHENRAQRTRFCFRENDHSELDFSSAKTELTRIFFLFFLSFSLQMPSQAPKTNHKNLQKSTKCLVQAMSPNFSTSCTHTNVKTPSSMAVSDSFPSSNTNSVGNQLCQI